MPQGSAEILVYLGRMDNQDTATRGSCQHVCVAYGITIRAEEAVQIAVCEESC